MRKTTYTLLALSLTVASATAARAQSLAEAEREEDYIRVVQAEVFSHRGRFGLSPTFGLTVNDPIVQQFLVGANLNYFITESLGLQAQFHYSFDAKRASQNVLLANQLRPELNPMQWVGTFGVEWIPAYGKFTLFNGPIVQWDAYLTGGAGYVSATRDSNITGAIGVGARFYLARWLTLVVEFRDYIYRQQIPGFDPNFINNVVFSIGAGFFLPPRG